MQERVNEKTVGINRPFAGCIVPLKYYRKDSRVMSVMIEINRRLYINSEIKKTLEYHRLKTDISGAIGLLQQQTEESNICLGNE